jgi:hypothetical protein
VRRRQVNFSASALPLLLTRCVGLKLTGPTASRLICNFEMILIYYFIIQIQRATFLPMKRLIISITATLLGVAASASAQTWSTVTPTDGGGYQFREYSPYGNSWGTMTPTYGGGYRLNNYGPNGNSWGTVTPTYGGGYRISRFGY